MTKLADFLASASRDGDLQMQFIATPGYTMQKAGLTGEDINAIQNADAINIRKIAGEDIAGEDIAEKDNENKGIMFCIMFDPSSGAPISENLH